MGQPPATSQASTSQAQHGAAVPGYSRAAHRPLRATGTLALAGGLQVASRDCGTGIKIVNSDILAAPCDLLAVCVCVCV